MLTDKKKLIRDACQLLGANKVRDGLGVTADVLKAWLDGSVEVSHSELRKLSELLTKYAAQ